MPDEVNNDFFQTAQLGRCFPLPIFCRTPAYCFSATPIDIFDSSKKSLDKLP
jgi:hypothetical protein